MPSAESRIKTPLSWNFLWILSLALSLSYLHVLPNLPRPTGQSQDVHSFFLCCTFFQREAESLGLRWLGSLQKRWVRTIQRTDSWPRWWLQCWALVGESTSIQNRGWLFRGTCISGLPGLVLSALLFTSLYPPGILRVGRIELIVVPVCHILTGLWTHWPVAWTCHSHTY